MKGRHLKTAFSIIPVLMMTACVSWVPSGPDYKAIDPDVSFSAASGATEITIDSGNQGCAGLPGAGNGCVGFGKKEYGTIRFQLNKNAMSKRCSDTPKADWVITRIQLSAYGDPDTEKGDFGRKQPGWLKRAFLGLDRANGVIFQAPNTTADNSVTIINLNNHRGKVKDIYYQITASTCDASPATIEIDPMVRNEGR